MGTSQMPWNLVGYKCYICYSTYENVSNDQPIDKEYRQRVMESCADTLFSEITGDEFDWNLIICNNVLPFCQRCWQSIEKIYNLNLEQEKTDSEIENIVKDIGMKVLSNRKYLKKKGILSTSKTNPIAQMEGVKIEGFTSSQTKCRMCHNVFGIGESQNLLPVDISRKIMECCEKHLYTELIDEDFFDWNSISFNQFVPFCEDCSLDIKNMLSLDEKLVGIEKYVSHNVDMFTLTVLKCRRTLKKAERRAFRRENGFRDDSSVADSIDSQDTLDFDDEIQIIEDSTIYPTSFAESTFSEPPSEFMEQQSSFETFKSKSNSHNKDPIRIEETVPLIPAEGASNSRYSYASENGLERPNSAETCVIPPQAQNSTVQGMTDRRDVRKKAPPLSVTLRMPIMRGSKEKNKVQPVAVALLPNETSGGLFKCPTCEKLFIYREAWDRHEKICPQPNRFSPQICCEETFTDEESWDDHRVSHRSLSFSTTRSKSKSLPLQSQPQSVSSRASRCISPRRDRRCQSQTPDEYSSASPFIFERRDRRCQSQTPDEYSSSKRVSKPASKQASGQSPEYSCNYCPKLCRTKTGLNLHIQSHTKKATYKCRLCKLLFRYPIELKTHYTNTHAENSPLNQSASNKSKSTKIHATTPRSKSSKKKRISFACPFCPFPIFGKNDLITHIQSHYDIAHGSRCEVCKVVFSSKRSIGPHNKSFHSRL